MFKNRKLFKDFVSGVKEHRYTTKEIKNILNSLPIEVVRRIGKEIIYSDFDGYNGNSKYCQLEYFDNLERWQKEFFYRGKIIQVIICVST